MTKQIVQAFVSERRPITKEGSHREVHHIELYLGDQEIPYVPGDCVAILPEHDPSFVKALLDRMHLDPEAYVVKRDESGSLHHFLSKKVVISALSKPFLEAVFRVMKWNNFPEETWREEFLGWDLLDAYTEWGPLPFSPQELIDLLPLLLPRFYSVASTPLIAKNKIALTVKKPKYLFRERVREGVCSRYLLSKEAVEKGISLFHHPHRGFGLPEPERPIIMVGPGTGIAPFRAFIHDRWHRRAPGKNWLFFGEWHRKTDYLYEEEWLFWEKEHYIDIDLAFSRDQTDKIYVQHRMNENSKKLFSWLEGGAIFYVCGDKERMAKDVERTLLEIILKEGGVDPKEYLKKLRLEKRYLRDVY